MLGLAVVGLLGMIAINAPQGHFGAQSEVTFIGWIYAGVLLLTAGVFGAASLRGWSWSQRGMVVLLALNVGAFTPALVHDFPIAAGVILWNILLAANQVVDVTARAARTRQTAAHRRDLVWLARHGGAARHLLLVSLLADLVVVGFEVTSSWVAEVICLLLGLAVAALTGPVAAAVARQNSRYLAVLPLIALAAPWGEGPLYFSLTALAIYQALVLALVLGRGPMLDDLIQTFLQRPALLLLSTFAALALVGGLVLSFPASAEREPLSFLDALFTATSAACITGLTVIDVSRALSGFGQVVLLVLIQIGGLGIMVLSTFATILLGGRLALRSEHALEELLDIRSPAAAYQLARFIVAFTLLVEAIGAVILTFRLAGSYELPLAEAAWRGVFHAVSSFCHAGFALWSDSLVSFREDPVVLGVHMALMVLGSLGFSVLAALWLRARGVARRFTLQTRVVLWATLGLTLAGTLLYALLEWDATLRGLSVGGKWYNALFQSITLRSGGFNSVDLAPIGDATVAVMLVFMFIGAAPGGTGGGIKVTTLAVLGAAIPALLRNHPRAVLFGRAMPDDIIYRAATIVVVAVFFAATASVIMLATHALPFAKVVFEVVSAVGTVGLSLGITAELHAVGKWVLIVLMFVGRVGPTSLALALGAQQSRRVAFPEGRLMVG